MVYTDSEYLRGKDAKFATQFTKWVHKKFFKAPGKIIDVGCGKGLYLCEFKKLNYQTCGVDVDEDAVKLARKNGVKVFKCNLERGRLPFRNDFFDYAFVRYVTPCVKNTRNFLKEIRRVLKPNGLFLMIELDWNRSRKTYYNGPYKIKKRFGLELLRKTLVSYNFKIVKARKFQNIPYIWRYTTRAFDFVSPNHKSIVIVSKKTV